MSGYPTPITPFLMFSGDRHGKAEEAINLYTSVFPNSRILSIERHGLGGQEKEGTVLQAQFLLNGQLFRAMDSAAPHSFNFTPSLSLFVTSRDKADFEDVVARLSEGGELLMPPDDYGFSQRFAWFNGRFGVSWQVNCE